MDYNIYYSPEKYGLVPVAELELTEPSYSFDTVVVWRHDGNGLLYWAHDAGCSCPTPFEDYTSLESLAVIFPDDYNELKRYVARSYDAAGRIVFLRKVRDALRKMG